jgi:nitroreductase
MNFFEAVKNRRSVRSYIDKEVEQEKLDVILQTINAAPSAGNIQGYEVVVVRNADTKTELMNAAYGQPFITQTPVVLVFCANLMLSEGKFKSRGRDLYATQDATIAAAYCQLAATSVGLSTVWVGAFDPDMVAKAIETPENIIPVAMIPIGYAESQPQMRPRRELNDIIRYESWAGKK